MNICVGNLTIIGSDNGLSPGRRQAIVWTSDRILFNGPLGTKFSEILIGIHKFFIHENVFENVFCEMAAILSRPQCIKPLISYMLMVSILFTKINHLP